MNNKNLILIPLLSSFLVLLILVPVFYNVQVAGRSMLLLQRFWNYGGVLEIFMLSVYSFLLTKLMLKDQNKARNIAWSIFSICFFGQFLAGLIFCDQCLMTGKLHFPIPALILGGPIYRSQIGFMTILFISTLLISGSAWCSQLCYFGAIENYFTNRKKTKHNKNSIKIRFTLFIFFIVIVLILRIFKVSNFYASILAIIFVIGAFFVIFIYSRKKGKMFHCTYYCPIGFIVSLYSKIYPIKVKINDSCDLCGKCVFVCKYTSISLDKNSKNMQITFGCTNCGDCINVCHVQAISYSFYKKQKPNLRNFWIVLTVVLHTTFLAFARI
ncbi:MAG TPA: 4Fe-4S binding protein [Bacteroidales bacterium]|jgi:polyferredoxin|nr:4Fe-4S binding protein [Bacteroidales bacterium]